MSMGGWEACTPTASYPLPPITHSKLRTARNSRSYPSMAAATIFSLCGSRCLWSSLRPEARLASPAAAARPSSSSSSSSCRRLAVVVAATEGSAKSSGEAADEKVPSWARPGSDEPPPWARDEGGAASQETASAAAVQVPFYAYLLASAVTAIAAIGSIYEYTNGRPVFGVVGTDSPLYAPLLGFFAFTGIPTSGFLWFKAVQTANKDAEEQDRKDGFL